MCRQQIHHKQWRPKHLAKLLSHSQPGGPTFETVKTYFYSSQAASVNTFLSVYLAPTSSYFSDTQLLLIINHITLLVTSHPVREAVSPPLLFPLLGTSTYTRSIRTFLISLFIAAFLPVSLNM